MKNNTVPLFISDSFRERITELRKKKEVSEYRMSLDMGRNKGYIQGIVAGKTMPSMLEFFSMCDYLGVEPKEFFDVEVENPALLQEAIEKLRMLNDDGIRAVIGVIDMMKDKYAQ